VLDGCQQTRRAPPTRRKTSGSDHLQEVVVTGIRAAIESAIKVKENADVIEETISAEGHRQAAGPRPSPSLSPGCRVSHPARQPGVTRPAISIRGLGPDFNGYLMNGASRPARSTARAVDLSVYPAELIAGATVYKSGDSALMTAGLAGTIDQRLVDPLKYDHLIAKGHLEGDRIGRGVPGQPVGKGKALLA